MTDIELRALWSRQASKRHAWPNTALPLMNRAGTGFDVDWHESEYQVWLEGYRSAFSAVAYPPGTPEKWISASERVAARMRDQALAAHSQQAQSQQEPVAYRHPQQLDKAITVIDLEMQPAWVKEIWIGGDPLYTGQPPASTQNMVGPIPYTRSDRKPPNQAWVNFNVRAEHAAAAEGALKGEVHIVDIRASDRKPPLNDLVDVIRARGWTTYAQSQDLAADIFELFSNPPKEGT
jgi:hypothetical protein